MRSLLKHSLLAGLSVSLALTGCAALPLKPNTLTLGQSVSADKAKSGTSAQGAEASLVDKNAGMTPVAAEKKPKSFALPTAVTLPLPAAVISAGGANVINAGGANYRVAGASHFSMAQVLKENVRVYVASTIVLNLILTMARNAQLEPGESRSFDFPMGGGKLNKLTMRLDTFDDHAVIAIGRGDSATGPQQLAAVSYQSPTQGSAVFHADSGLLKNFGKVYVATTFDLTKGEATADAVEDSSDLAVLPRKTNAHWVFKHHAGAKAGEKAFSMTAAASIQRPNDAENSGTYAVLANFASQGGAAALAGLSTPASGNRFTWLPSNSAFSLGDEAAPVDFYVNDLGADLATPSEAIKKLLPAKSALPASFPASPSEGDPFADPRYAFPR